MKRLSHKFVEYVPEKLEEDVIYISLQFGIVSNLCPCGCGEEIVIKLSPLDWRLIYDGETVTLRPSIGNWGLPCRSHYFITESRIEWAAAWSKERVNAARGTTPGSRDGSRRVITVATPLARGRAVDTHADLATQFSHTEAVKHD